MNDQRSRLKRKDHNHHRESVYPAKRPPPPPPPPKTTVTSSKIMKTGNEKMTSSNKLLAGYMAYEFLTKGTMLGKKIDGAKVDVERTSGNERYKEITNLLMMKNENGGVESVRIPGIVNPTQLARWIQM